MASRKVVVMAAIGLDHMGMLTGLCVPGMGMHAIAGDVIAGAELFDAALLVDSYGGAPISFEPVPVEPLRRTPVPEALSPSIFPAVRGDVRRSSDPAPPARNLENPAR
jgi:hypothetical protein